ncbi:transposable element Tc1 transposase [Trichonephila clavipes]|nr:transposable element Tc1 transposase [Trichonephila clavipes]
MAGLVTSSSPVPLKTHFDGGAQAFSHWFGVVVKKSFKTVIYNRWLHRKKYLVTGTVENKPRPGGTSKLTSRAKRMIVIVCSIRNVLHSAGLKARTPRKKPYISEVNRKRRLEFVMKYKKSPWIFGKRLFFLMRASLRFLYHQVFEKFGEKNKTAREPKNVLPTLKHGGGNVMVWGCVAHNRAGNLAFIDNKMNALAYIDVLRHNLLDSAKKLSMVD